MVVRARVHTSQVPDLDAAVVGAGRVQVVVVAEEHRGHRAVRIADDLLALSAQLLGGLVHFVQAVSMGVFDRFDELCEK